MSVVDVGGRRQACENHGPDENKRETDFHFDTRDGMFLKEGSIAAGTSAPAAELSNTALAITIAAP